MSAPLNPRQIFVLERYSSLPYYSDMRDAFARMLEVAEEALRQFMLELPADYRSRPTWEQPDRSWGEVVLPNMRWTMQALDDGWVQLQSGDFDGLGMAGNVTTALAGMQRDFVFDWMSPAQWQAFDSAWTSCSRSSFNIQLTYQASWSLHALTRDDPQALSARGPLNAPPSWPQYRVNPSVKVQTDAAVPRTGIYLPDADLGSAQFLIEGHDGPLAEVAETVATNASVNDVPTTWTLVERIADSGGGIPGDADPVKAGIRLRCEAGQACPRAGFWFTPARLPSRKHFGNGELMPDVGGPYGATIWQWDEQQD